MWFGRAIKVYTVHVRSSERRPQERPIFVQEGFNWYAFLFGVFWALYHRMWRVAFLLLLASACFVMLDEKSILSPGAVTIAQFGFQVMVGFWANDWLRKKLASTGYVMVDMTASDSKTRAEQRYFERYVSAHPSY